MESHAHSQLFVIRYPLSVAHIYIVNASLWKRYEFRSGSLW